MKPDDPTPRVPRKTLPETGRSHRLAVAGDSNPSADPLADALRRGAARTRPIFSAARHARLSQALAAARLEPPEATERWPRYRIAPWALSLAAAAALVAWLAWPRAPQPGLPSGQSPSTAAAQQTAQQPSIAAMDPTPLTELAHDTAIGMEGAMHEALNDIAWHYLGQDAAAAWDVVHTALLPLTPADSDMPRG